jgi:predicted patatin/cPLA2 family phospholipase
MAGWAITSSGLSAADQADSFDSYSLFTPTTARMRQIVESPTIPDDLSVLFPGLGDTNYQPVWQDAPISAAHLVVEGGSMRTHFTTGILDFLMDQKLLPKAIIGTSAGAMSSLNYKAGTRGRTIYTSLYLCNDWQVFSKRSFLTSGNLFNVECTFQKCNQGIAPFDYQAFVNSPIDMVSVSVDMKAGKAHYHHYHDLATEMGYLKASVALPLVFQIIDVDGLKLMDGGMYDSVPIRYSLDLGAKKQIVILTQPPGFVKQKHHLIWLMRMVYRKYPQFVDAIANRHNIYNETYKFVEQLEAEDKIFVMRPSGNNTVTNMEHDKQKLYALYREGYQHIANRYGELLRYLES